MVDSFVPCLPFRIPTPVKTSPSRASQIFPNSDTPSNSLRPLYDRNVATYLNEHLDHRRNLDAPAGTEPPISVADYIARYSWCLAICSYQEMLQQADTMTFRDDMGRKQEIMLSAWRKGWNHWGGCSALELHFSSSETELSFILCWEEADYEVLLALVFAFFGRMSKANSLTVQVGNILRGWYWQIVCGSWTVTSIAVEFGTSS